ncbi:MAG TPA: hypothetical protein VK102_02955 [Sphingobacterium sp.]|nr:hypothetical protein [Sphingobacterium sp.]
MKKDTSLQVIYIAGNPFSGSTLLDIILGSNEGCFSAGELSYITRDTIMEEYCSCNKRIPKCEVWSEVIKEWEAVCEISYQQYQELKWRYERKKTFFRTLLNYYRPSTNFKEYCYATLQLFQAIQKVTGCSVIIDSSKSPQRIPVLSKIVNLKVIHLCRDFTGVLNSFQGSPTKDVKAGIEESRPPGRTWKVMLDWISTNLANEIFCIGIDSQKVLYKNYVSNPESLQDIHPILGGINVKQSFSADHMLAGNKLRLKKGLIIDPKAGFKYDNLNTRLFKFARMLDDIFPYWS